MAMCSVVALLFQCLAASAFLIPFPVLPITMEMIFKPHDLTTGHIQYDVAKCKE